MGLQLQIKENEKIIVGDSEDMDQNLVIECFKNSRGKLVLDFSGLDVHINREPVFKSKMKSGQFLK